MPDERLVTLWGVRVVSEAVTLICEHDGKRFGVPRHYMQKGTEIRNVGDVGKLVVPRWLVADIHGS